MKNLNIREKVKELHSVTAICPPPKFYCICFITYLSFSLSIYEYLFFMHFKVADFNAFAPKYFRIHIINESNSTFSFFRVTCLHRVKCTHQKYVIYWILRNAYTCVTPNFIKI